MSLGDAVLDVDQVAALLRCAAATVEAHARDGKLPGLKFGTSWIFPADALIERLNSLARDEARDRAAPPPTPSAVLHQVPQAAAGGRRRAPLPKLPNWPPAG